MVERERARGESSRCSIAHGIANYNDTIVQTQSATANSIKIRFEKKKIK